jgi:RNA polymerase sigma-70 factor (ECF subfamily)
MSPDPFEVLLRRLNGGDESEVQEAFSRLEPFVKMIVRRHLSPRVRSKIDPTDIVQSVWVELLKGFRDSRWSFPDARHLRAFLAKLTHDRAIDRCRHLGRAADHESPLGEGAQVEVSLPSTDPGPVERVQAEELWEQMLSCCPAEHRGLLLLRRQGLDVQEIARRSGLHESSVRRILADVARRLAAKSKIFQP